MTLLILYSVIIAIYFWITLEYFFHYNKQCSQLMWLAFIFSFINVLLQYLSPSWGFFCKESSMLLAFFGNFLYMANENVWEHDDQRLCYQNAKETNYLFLVGFISMVVASTVAFSNHWIGLIVGIFLFTFSMMFGLLVGTKMLMLHKYPKGT